MRHKQESLSFPHTAGRERKAAAPRKVSCAWGAIVEAAADFKAVKERGGGQTDWSHLHVSYYHSQQNQEFQQEMKRTMCGFP